MVNNKIVVFGGAGFLGSILDKKYINARIIIKRSPERKIDHVQK